MKAQEVVHRITTAGGVFLRQRGSHRFYRVERKGVVAHTTVSGKDRDDVPIGLLRKIERDLKPVLGEGWLR